MASMTGESAAECEKTPLSPVPASATTPAVDDTAEPKCAPPTSYADPKLAATPLYTLDASGFHSLFNVLS